MPKPTEPLPPDLPLASPGELEELYQPLLEIRAQMLALEELGLRGHPAIHPSYAASARNLLHYLALRAKDLRGLQPRLMRLGLSSLGRCEAHALSSLDAVLRVLGHLAGRTLDLIEEARGVGVGEGQRLLERHAEDLLGPPRIERRVRILVTMPDEAACEPALVRAWAERGMDAARINCAHGDPATWERMLANLHAAGAHAGRRLRVLMDLAGPKLRTGPIEPGPAVLKVKPERDELGRVLRPAFLWLTGQGAPVAAPPECAAVAPIDDGWLAALAPGAVLELEDARGARRELRVLARERGGARLAVHDTCYLVPGLTLRIQGAPAREAAVLGALPARVGEIRLQRGDRLVLTRSLAPGHGARRDAEGRLLAPARVGCTLPEVFDRIRPGEAVWFDDGRIGARVLAAGPEEVELEVVSARAAGSKLRADKGINLPDTELCAPALTPKDEQDLPFVVAHADAVALSFVRSAEDVVVLEDRLAALGRPELGIVLKIETRKAFERLPQLLLASMRSPRDGVMIARGDLAIECGFERMAEVQEEILWICEAAHVPVIWATQVLETLAREGRPSRAEITDAAMSERAECVMLNKGPHITEAVGALDDILRRMEGHQRKKAAMLRPLGLARRHFG